MVRPPSFWIPCCALLVSFLCAAPGSAERVLVASNAIWTVDTDTGSARELAGLGLFVKDLEVDAAGQTGYAATSEGILEIDLVTGETLRTFGDGPARYLELDEASGKLFGMFTLGKGVAPEIRAFSLADGQQLGSSSLPLGTTAIHRDAVENAVLGLEHGGRTLHLYDATTVSARSVIELPDRVGKSGVNTLAPEVLVHESSGMIIAPELGAEAGIWVVRPGAAAEWIALGHEAHFRGGAITADGRFVYLSALDHVAKVDLEQKREVAWVGLDVVHQRIALSADESSLFLTVPVTGDGGALSVLSADTLEPVGRIPVREISPFALAVVPE